MGADALNWYSVGGLTSGLTRRPMDLERPRVSRMALSRHLEAPLEIDDSVNWRVNDPFPGRPLSEIEPVSLRGRALLARNLSQPAVSRDFLRIGGAVDMLGAFDYHFANIARLEASLDDYFHELDGVRQGRPGRMMTADEQAGVQAARYEAIAYFATVGRFYCFVQSEFVQSRFTPSGIPTIERLMAFRHKVAAHRSIDSPRNESRDLQSLQALSLASAGGQLFKPVGENRLALQYQLIRENRPVENFVPLEDHPCVVAEAYGVLERLLR